MNWHNTHVSLAATWKNRGLYEALTHALLDTGFSGVAASTERSSKGLFAFPTGLSLRRLSSRSGVSREAGGCISHRKRVEGSSARLTRMHGDVEPNSKAHRPRVKQRVLFDASGRPNLTNSVGWVYPAPGTFLNLVNL